MKCLPNLPSLSHYFSAMNLPYNLWYSQMIPNFNIPLEPLDGQTYLLYEHGTLENLFAYIRPFFLY